MPIGRPKAELVLSAEEQAQLSALAASRSLPHALVARARLVLWAAAGDSNSAIAERLDWSMPTVGKWRQRFIEQRMAGLHDELRPGRPRTYGGAQVAGLINRVLRSQPKHATHWSVRSVAEDTGIFQEHRGPLLRAVWRATPPQQEFQAFHRPVLRGKSPRCGGPLPQSAGQRLGAVRG